MKPFTALISLLALLLFGGCIDRHGGNISSFTTDIYTPEYASGFSITRTEHGVSSLVSVHNPWQGASNVEQHLFIVRDDETPPYGFTGQVVTAPIRRVVCMSSSHVAMFDAIGQVRRVVGVSGIDYISNQYVQEHRYCGEVRDVGYDTNIDFELLASMRPSLVLLYGVTGENTTITGKLRELALPYMYIGDYVEESPLGKAEWMVVVAELCDCREEGIAIFDGIRDRYQALRASVQEMQEMQQTQDMQEPQPIQPMPRPRVMLNTPYRDTWFMPSTRNYMIRLIEDAGGEYIYTQNTGDSSVAVDLEEAYLLANSADVWLNVGPANTLAELTAQNPKFATVPAVTSRRVYNNNSRQTLAGGSDFWESGVVCPDKVLEDLIRLFNDEEGLYYYKRLR